MSGSPRLLFVDDELAVQRAFTRSMHGVDIVVECAGGVTEAIVALQSREFDVVVTDMTMTDGTGLDVLQAMLVYAPNTARLVLSGDQDVADVVKGVPVDGIMTKPWDVKRLRKMVLDAVALTASRANPT